ncbi:hypothetical protein NMG60_11026646 [Bertholletia excelsa]
MATAEWDEDEWELVNDDGFVYKRKKRPRLDPSVTAVAPRPPDPAAEERSRRERKRRALVKLREKYQKEIEQWEHLSNMLKAWQEKAPNQQRQEQTTSATTTSCDLSVNLQEQSSESAACRLLDELLRRAEAEEAIIQDMSHLCDVAEAICSAQEEQMKQSLVNLPVWASPNELMASLCDD